MKKLNNQPVLPDSLLFPEKNYSKPFAISLHSYRISPHLPNQKLTAFNTYVYRSSNICSSENLLKVELN